MYVPPGRIPHEILNGRQLRLLPQVVEDRLETFWAEQQKFEASFASELCCIEPNMRKVEVDLWVVRASTELLPQADDWEQAAELFSERIGEEFMQSPFYGD